tara:strand:+ start:17568 stop:17867 length:300 start_codon:yes stop_codon:yes gene_type:complete
LKTDKLLLELELLLEQCDYRLRKERGSFRGNNCVIEGDRLVIVNKNKPLESQIGTIARILSTVDLSSIYIKPAVKKELGILWDRLTVSPHSPGDELEFD